MSISPNGNFNDLLTVKLVKRLCLCLRTCVKSGIKVQCVRATCSRHEGFPTSRVLWRCAVAKRHRFHLMDDKTSET